MADYAHTGEYWPTDYWVTHWWPDTSLVVVIELSADRTFTVEAESRTASIAAESRSFAVSAEDRTYTVTGA